MAVKNNMSKEELQSLKSSTYIYSHPENIINNEDVIQNKVCVIVVDEAHCVIDWGTITGQCLKK